MATDPAIEAANARLLLDRAVIALGVPVVAVSAWDAHLIYSKHTSISRHLGRYARNHPVRFWAAWLGAWGLLGAHVAFEFRNDPLVRYISPAIKSLRRTP